MATEREPSGWAAGWITFAGFMLILIGSFHAIAGLVGLINDETFVLTQEYVLKFDTTTWGWIHLIGGIIVVLAGFGLFSGAVWARTLGVIVALISAMASVGWLPYQPVWSTVIIAIDVAVIRALTAHGRDVQRMSGM